MPSPTTINRQAREYGNKLTQFLPDCVAETNADAVIPDGTKCHSQDDDRSYHSVQATLGEDTAEESRSLLDLSVNADWDETATELDDIDAVTDDATVVSDGDSSIVTAFTDDSRDHQLDLVHVASLTSARGTPSNAIGRSKRPRSRSCMRRTNSQSTSSTTNYIAQRGIFDTAHRL